MINKLLWPVITVVIATIIFFIWKIFIASDVITISPQPGGGEGSTILVGKELTVELQQMHMANGVFGRPHTIRVNNEPITLGLKMCFELPLNKPIFRITLESFDEENGMARYLATRVILSNKNCSKPPK